MNDTTAIKIQASSLQIMGARILVKERRMNATTDSGIVIPGQEKVKTNQGIVLQVGNGTMLQDGTIVPVAVPVGATVIYPSFSGSPIVVDDVKEAEDSPYIILNERDIMCYVDENKE